MYTSYYSDTPRHKSSTVPLVTAQSVITRRYCGTSLLTGTSRSSLITAGCSADYTTTRRRIGTSCTGTKDRANTGAMLKKCFRILTSLQTGAAFSLLPSRLRYLEEGRHRKRNQLETEGEREGRERGEREREREDYFENIYRQVRYCTLQQLLIVFSPTNSCKFQTNLLYRAPTGSVPTRPPTNP